MKAVWVLCILFVVLGGFLAAPTYADYHYASHEGSNEYPYTSWATGAHLIQDAIDATDPHDTLYIGSGDWFGSSATEYWDSLAIIGMGMDSTFCYSDSFHTAVLTIDYECLVEGITFEHTGGWFCIRARTYAGYTVKNCRFEHSYKGIQSAGGISEISNCIFDSCAVAIQVAFGGIDYHISNNLVLYSYDHWAIDIDSYTFTIENNIVLIEPGGFTNGIAAGLIYASGIARNNIVLNGRMYGIGISGGLIANNSADSLTDVWNAGISSGNATLVNNSITNCYNAIWLSESIYSYYNNFWNNFVSYFPGGGEVLDSIGNIYADPMYVGEFDFHLQAYSPLIDIGDPGILDIDGTRSDIGAYGGPYGEDYDYLDLPPRIPDSLLGEIAADTAYLGWRYNTESDFANYQLHRDTITGFTPSLFNLLAEPDTSVYTDSDLVPGLSYYYRISALDNQGNMSAYSDELALTPTSVWDGLGVEPPRITTIEGNYPNPFNSLTTIIYRVANLGPIPAKITIEIYDIMGRKVRSLLDERKELGVHRIVWDGKGDGGYDCPSGIYFAKIKQWDLGFTGRHQKLLLMR